MPTPKSEGHTPWLFEDIEKFRARWGYGTLQRAASELSFWLGSRISDCVGLGNDNVTHDGWITFTQKKTGSEVSVPFRRALPSFATPEDLEYLHKALEALDAPRSTFLETALGDPRSAKGASQWFSEAAQAAEISAGKTSHGLRKSRMILLAERGATLHQIAAWSGHETLKEIERYTKKANNKKILTPSVLVTGEFLR